MSINSHVSLIDLGKQLPFEIDDNLKKEICFGETLIISCGHYEGDIGEESSDSEWSCQDTTESEASVEQKDTAFEIKDRVEEEANEEEVEEEENDFHIYFFPDCNKPPPPRDSKASLMIEDGLPRINPAAKGQITCTCDIDKRGKCACHTKLPCKCGAKTTMECTCSKVEDVCICHDGMPQPVCTCKGSNVCLCHPDGKIRAVCTCDIIDKPCICHPGKFPSPVCTCKYKPKFNLEDIQSIGEYEYENEQEEEGKGKGKGEGEITCAEGEIEQEPCECQKTEPIPRCLCMKGKECTCKEKSCICGVQSTCVCEPTDSHDEICKSNDSKSFCSCPVPKECTCDAKSSQDCTCFPQKKCSCGDPENCKCFAICDCTDPCICDTAQNKEEECICLDKSEQVAKGLVCTCRYKEKESKKLKRVRAGKHGYVKTPHLHVPN